MKEDLRCPVCQARFRASAECSRCGADLTALMLLAAHAYLLRQTARQSLMQRDCQTALASVQVAQHLHSTEEGSLLRSICVLVANTLSGQAQRPG